jgi:hypothetical protein
VTITPDQPTAGQEVTMTFEYDLDEEVTGGTSS